MWTCRCTNESDDPPDDIDQAHRTQAWLAASDEPEAQTSAGYYYHLALHEPNPLVYDIILQDKLLAICHDISGVSMG